MKRLCILGLAFASCTLFCNELPQPYCSINPKTAFLQKDCSAVIKEMAVLLADKTKPTVIFMNPGYGESCIEFLRNFSDSTAIAVSRWDLFSYDKEPRRTYHQFLSNIIQLGYATRVIPHRMSSAEFIKVYDVNFDAVFIDSSYSPNLTEDLTIWVERLITSNFICGSGALSSEVRNIIHNVMTSKPELKFFSQDDFWILRL